jgi:hypothetical protein
MIESGIYTNLSNEEYHSDPAISRSGIKIFNECPFKYWAHYLNPARPAKKTSDVMEFGSAFHTYVLEPDLLPKLYILEPEIPKLPKVGLKRDLGAIEYEKQKAARESQSLSNRIMMERFEYEMENKIIIKQKDFETMMAMKNALMKDKEAWDLIQGAKFEHSYFWMDEHSGLMCKARPDILHHHCIVDLKTCESADSHTYKYTMAKEGYHIQGAIIREGVKQITGNDISTVININIEKKYPHAIGIKIISQSALEAGYMTFKNTLLEMKECFQTNKWRSYEAEEVDLPNRSK